MVLRRGDTNANSARPFEASESWKQRRGHYCVAKTKNKVRRPILKKVARRSRRQLTQAEADRELEEIFAVAPGERPNRDTFIRRLAGRVPGWSRDDRAAFVDTYCSLNDISLFDG
jgi:hypothetical protein